MRRYLTILCLFALTVLPLTAQSGLHINSLFNGQFKENEKVSEVYLKGKQIRDYGLTLFRSLTLPGNSKEAQQIEALVLKDAANCSDKEEGKKGNRLYYGFYALKATKSGQNRYIFYRNNALQKNAKPVLSLVYMEGTASIDQLRRQFGGGK